MHCGGSRSNGRLGGCPCGQDEVAVRLREIVTAMQEGPMAEFPGACHASVARPDLLKFEFATQAEDEAPGRSKLKRLERQYRSEREYVTQWRRREWQRWFEQRVAFPFEAVVLTNEGPVLHTVEDIARIERFRFEPAPSHRLCRCCNLTQRICPWVLMFALGGAGTSSTTPCAAGCTIRSGL